jgi:two-component system OmpR family response regulator
MTNTKTRTIFLVDDDALILKSLEIEFKQSPDLVVETFSTGELCIEKLRLSNESMNGEPPVIVLDYHLDSIDPKAMNGLETLDKIKLFDASIPVIMLSSQDKIDVAVNCMKHGASDYIVKTETAFIRLQKAINDIFENLKTKKQLKWYMERM